jgi:hypothetical protein
MSQPNPYAADLGNRDALEALNDTPDRIRELVKEWPANRFDRSYAPGKWSARELLIHLAQTELALGTRIRYALSHGGGYVAQAFSQDDWMPLDNGADARMALDVYTSLRRLNASMFRGLSADRRNTKFQHPEYGELTVGWVAAQLAGHDIHHLKQLELIR